MSGRIVGTYAKYLISPDVQPETGDSCKGSDGLPITKNQPGDSQINMHDRQTYVWIPSGTFTMGCSSDDKDCAAFERPPHQVTITKGFWLGETPVTVRAWNSQRIQLGGLPRLATRDTAGRSFNTALDMPALGVSWNDAQKFCDQAGGRLPTEAEWEYAARSGSRGARYGDIEAIAWYAGNSGRQQIDSVSASEQVLLQNANGPHAVRQKQPNSWNLYDMLGNTWQWTADWYAEDYYKRSPGSDPKGPPTGSLRVMRGGSWFDMPFAIRASTRFRQAPDLGLNTFGFRCAADDLGTGPLRSR
jgi:formylglycine-generating enzyme required for sulfatase activity